MFRNTFDILEKLTNQIKAFQHAAFDILEKLTNQIKAF